MGKEELAERMNVSESLLDKWIRKLANVLDAWGASQTKRQ